MRKYDITKEIAVGGFEIMQKKYVCNFFKICYNY